MPTTVCSSGREPSSYRLWSGRRTIPCTSWDSRSATDFENTRPRRLVMLRKEFRPVMRDVSMDIREMPQANTRPVLRSAATSANARSGHPTLTVAFHWVTVLAIVVAVAAMFVRDAVEDRVWRQLLLETHRQLGLLVLIAA